jgi:hypothetical protein
MITGFPAMESHSECLTYAGTTASDEGGSASHFSGYNFLSQTRLLNEVLHRGVLVLF